MPNLADAITSKAGKECDRYWHPNPMWKGETVFVIGGGPSILNFDINRLRKRNCIAVNNSHEIAPWSRFLFFHDKRWLEWHLEAVRKFKGECVTSHTRPMPIAIRRMRKDRKIAINCTDHTCVAGVDSGTMAVNLAFHLGAKTIALVGFDMGFTDVGRVTLDKKEIRNLQIPLKRHGYECPESRAMDKTVLKHWHQEHPIPPRLSNYERFLRQYPDLIRTLHAHDRTLVTLTPTKIRIPKVNLDAI